MVLDDGVYRSRGETILGADDKAAVAVLIELAARHVRDPGAAGVELLLTVAEEEGLRGAKAFDHARCVPAASSCSTTRARSAR